MNFAVGNAGAKDSDQGRPSSIEDVSNRYFVHPLSRIVERYAIRLGVSANTVSFLGLGAGMLASVFYFFQADRRFVVAGFLAMVLWHIFDGADGRIARATGTSSAFGRIIDGVCDHLVFSAVYIAFALYIAQSGDQAVAWLLAIAAGVSHAAQAASYEERRQTFQRRLKGEDRMTTKKKNLIIAGSQSFLATFYDLVQQSLSNRSQLDQAMADYRKRGASSEAIEGVIRQTRPIVRAWSILNANNRTIMLAVFAWFGRPALYFAYEVLVLNAALLILLLLESRNESSLAAKLGDFPGVRV